MGADHFTTDEQQLLEALTNGDAKAFTVLYYRYGLKVHAHLLRMVKSEEIAAEILQEIFVKIWESRKRIDAGRPFAPFLYRVAENKVYDHFRRLAREKRIADSLAPFVQHAHTDTENEVMYEESLRLINSAIERLPPARKNIYRLSKIEGKSYDEIASLLGVSVSTINDHIVKANRFLKKALSGHTDAVVVWTVLFRLFGW